MKKICIYKSIYISLIFVLTLSAINLEGKVAEHAKLAPPEPAVINEVAYETETEAEMETENEEELRMDLSDEDLTLMARAIHSEARGESFKGQVAVGAVIINRIEDDEFPNTVSEVIFEPLAFTAVADGQFWLEPNEQSYEAAQIALQGEDPSEGALYYYNPVKSTSSWIFTRQTIKQIGKHLFAI